MGGEQGKGAPLSKGQASRFWVAPFNPRDREAGPRGQTAMPRERTQHSLRLEPFLGLQPPHSQRTSSLAARPAGSPSLAATPAGPPWQPPWP